MRVKFEMRRLGRKLPPHAGGSCPREASVWLSWGRRMKFGCGCLENGHGGWGSLASKASGGVEIKGEQGCFQSLKGWGGVRVGKVVMVNIPTTHAQGRQG